MAVVLLEELALLWPREPERLDMMKNEKDLVFWKENALKNALKMKKMKRCEWKIQKMPRICNRSRRGAHHLITGIRLYAWGARHVKIGACLLPSEKEEKRRKIRKRKKKWKSFSKTEVSPKLDRSISIKSQTKASSRQKSLYEIKIEASPWSKDRSVAMKSRQKHLE